MKKRFYVKPQVKAIEIEASAILAGSTGDAKPITLKDGQGYEEENW